MENNMTLDEAIEHANEISKRLGDCDCGKEHKQLREWLTELKEYREELRVIDKPILSKKFMNIEFSNKTSINYEERVLEKLDRIIELLSQK